MNETNFSKLELTKEIQKAIDDMGFENPTEIQIKAIPKIRTGVDIIGKSQTGTGKTLAFSIPAIEKIDVTLDKPTVQVLIICPTRELAQQGYSEIKKLTKYLPKIKAVDIYGGVPMERQISKLKKAHIVIGTPGRIMDHLRRRTLKLQNMKLIVLDEADEMLSMGFKEDIETILKDTPKEKQTVLFSATMPPAIMNITDNFLKNPISIKVSETQMTVNKINQTYVDVPKGENKKEILNSLLNAYNEKLTIVFCNTKRMVDDITEFLNKNGFTADSLHGDIRQKDRTKVMNKFKSAKTSVLVATDVAARGIDVKNVEYVINFDMPQSTEDYVHRIGRTARGGKAGNAITIINTKKQFSDLKNIKKETDSKINILEIPKEDPLKNKERTISSVIKAIGKINKTTHKDTLDELLDLGYTGEQIARAMIMLHFDKDTKNIHNIKEVYKEKEKRKYTDKKRTHSSDKRKKSNAKAKTAKEEFTFSAREKKYRDNKKDINGRKITKNKRRSSNYNIRKTASGKA